MHEHDGGGGHTGSCARVSGSADRPGGGAARVSGPIDGPSAVSSTVPFREAGGPTPDEAPASAMHAAPPEAWQGTPPAGYGWPPAPPSRLSRFFTTVWTRPRWLAPLAVLACMAAAAGYVLTNNPTDAQRDPLGPCVFKALTGLDCPGCGGTRMVWYVLHGDLPQAARHHVIALVALPVVLWLYVVWAARRWFGVTLPSRRIPVQVWGGYLVAWLIFTVLRDLPWEPFSLLLV